MITQKFGNLGHIALALDGVGVDVTVKWKYRQTPHRKTSAAGV